MDSSAHRRRVLVTGASGRVGRHVVDALAGDYEVTVLDLSPPVQDVPFIEGNVLDLDTVRASMAGQEAVIHLAAIDFGVPAEPEAYFGTMFIAADDSASPVPTLERLTGVYGATPPVREPAWFERDPRASPIDASRAKQRLGWRPTSTWTEVAARRPLVLRTCSPDSP